MTGRKARSPVLFVVLPSPSKVLTQHSLGFFLAICHNWRIRKPDERKIVAIRGRPIGKLHQDDIRKKIQSSQLVNRLTDHALGVIDLSNTQIKAIEILLKKSVPDLSSIQLSGDSDNPVETVNKVVFEVVNPQG